jgi:hypothetical protein
VTGRPEWLTEEQEMIARQMASEINPDCGLPYGRRAIAKELGISDKKARRLMSWLKPEGPVAGEKWETSESHGNFSIISNGRTIRTAEEAIRKADVDMDEYYVHEQSVNSWTTPISDPAGNVTVVENWQVKVVLRRRMPKPVSDGLKSIIKNLPAYTPPNPAPAILTPGQIMLETGFYDHHFGKYAWAPETGASYDLTIARDLYADAMRQALDRVHGESIAEIVVPIGHDMFHYDNIKETTASGTPMDSDGRPSKVFEEAFFSLLSAVEMARRVAPVRIVWVPGNHDPSWSHHLLVALFAAFRHDDMVTVDLDKKSRKYLEWGVNLIGLCHAEFGVGKWRLLPLVMAQESEAWTRTKCKEIHTGHLHTRKALEIMSYDEFAGIMVRRLPSLCATDKWHFDNLYVKNMRMAECYVWHKQYGLLSTEMIHAPEHLTKESS